MKKQRQFILISAITAILLTTAPGSSVAYIPTSMNFSNNSNACPSDFTSFDLVPDSPTTEASDLYKLVTCSNPATKRGYVKNNADEVWVIDSPSGLYWIDDAKTVSAFIFRSSLNQLQQENLIPAPGGLPVEPGTEAFFSLSSPSRLRVSLDPNLQALWHAQQAVQQKIVTRGQDLAVKVMSGNSNTRKTLLACGLSGYRAANTLNEGNGHVGIQLKTYLDVTNDLSPCGLAIRDAETEAKARNFEPLITRSETIATTESSTWLSKTARGLRAALSRFHGI